MERSELIDFIERRRAQTLATPTASHAASEPQLAGSAQRSDSVSSKRSDSSERSFKRSTARLADVNPVLAKQPAEVPSSRGLRHTSWYNNAPPRPSEPAVSESAHGSPALRPAEPPLSSSRVVPRSRVLASASDPRLDGDFTSALSKPLPPPSPAVHRSNEALAPPRIFARAKRPESAHLERTPATAAAAGALAATSAAATATAAYNPYSRTPRVLSASVQTDESLSGTTRLGLKPLVPDSPKPPVATRAVQTAVTAADNIHSDEAVLDLMRQMDGLRTGHANQITEYQEQVLELELMNHDLHSEVEQLALRLEAKEAAHKQAVDEMRQRLEATRQRLDREIGEVKGMHAAKCNEISDQVCMLLDRCEKYKQRLTDLGVSEDELLQLATRPTQPSNSDAVV
ncbi:hypothetical protein EV174_005938, partial [Coemansia sp. RSA 2320]